MKKIYFLMMALVCAFVASAADVTIYVQKANKLAENANLYYWDGGLTSPAWPGVAFTDTEVGEDGNTYWKMTISPTSAFSILFNAGGDDSKTADIANLSIENPEYWFYVDNDNSYTQLNEVEKVYAEHVYVIGDVEGNGWDPNKGKALDHQGEGVYEIEGVQISDAGAGFGYFSFAEKLSTSGNWDDLGVRWGPNAADKGIVLGTEDTNLTNNWAGGTKSWKIAAGKYNMTLDTENLTLLVVDTATAIESVSVDANAPVEYYNLQGVKVANPENGIFIKKQGAKATKVVL